MEDNNNPNNTVQTNGDGERIGFCWKCGFPVFKGQEKMCRNPKGCNAVPLKASTVLVKKKTQNGQNGQNGSKKQTEVPAETNKGTDRAESSSVTENRKKEQTGLEGKEEIQKKHGISECSPQTGNKS